MRAPAKNPVGAHYGLLDWLLQRLTAVAMAAYTLLLGGLVLWCPPASRADWRALFSGDFLRPLTMLFVLALLYHAWVGVRDILMDYVKPTGARLGLQAAVGFALLFYAVWAVSILWGAR